MRRSHLLLLVYLLLLGWLFSGALWGQVPFSLFSVLWNAHPFHPPLSVHGSKIRHVLWGNWGWKERIFPLIFFHYWK